MRIADAAAEVLKAADRPLHVREVVQAIEDRNLYTFNTKDPAGVVSKALRKHSEDAPGADSNSHRFRKSAPGTYTLAE